MKSYVVDTYAWVSYFEGNVKFKEEIENSELSTPSIVLAEISRVLERKRVPRDKSARILAFVRENSLILSLDATNAAEAGKVAENEGLCLIDGIIYSYVDEHTHLLTGDRHFKDKPLVNLIEDNL